MHVEHTMSTHVIKKRMVRRDDERIISELHGDWVITRLYSTISGWYRQTITDADGMGVDGEGLSADEACEIAADEWKKLQQSGQL